MLSKYILFPVRKSTRKEMFYLMTHSTHFIYGYMASDKSTTPIVLKLSFIQIYYLGLTFLNCDDQMRTGAFNKERKGNVLFNDALNTF